VNEAGLFTNTTRPDLSDLNGVISVACAHCGKETTFWMSAWRKVSKAGAKYLSLKLRPKRIGEHGATGTTPAAAGDGDDIPQW
jgi:hypothetical protein